MFLIHLNSTIKTGQNILQAFLRKHFLFQTQELYLTQNKPSVNPYLWDINLNQRPQNYLLKRTISFWEMQGQSYILSSISLDELGKPLKEAIFNQIERIKLSSKSKIELY